MVCEHSEGVPFQEEMEVPYSEVQHKELLVKGAVLLLSRLQLAAEESEQAPGAIDQLFQDPTNCSVGGICGESCWCCLNWMVE